MSTAPEIVTKALRRLGVIDSAQSPAADDMRDGSDALDVMIASWASHGVDVTLDIPLGAKFEQAIIAMLAMRLADDYGSQPGPVVQRDAESGWRMLQAAYITAPDATFDPALIRTQGRFGSGQF